MLQLMLPYHFALVCVTCCALFLHPCAAQDGGDVTLRFITFPMGLDLKPAELLVGENGSIQIEMTTNELSPPYKVSRQASWSIGETVSGQDGKNTFKVYGRSKALASPSQIVLLIRKGENYSDGIEVMPVDNRTTNFGGGKFLFFNGARIDIAGDLGGEKFVVKPMQHTIVKPKSNPGDRTFQTVFWFRKDDEAMPFFSSMWPHSDAAKSFVFFYHEPGTDFLRFHTIRSFPQ